MTPTSTRYARTISRLVTFDPADTDSRGYRLELLDNGLARISYRSNRIGDLDGCSWIAVPPEALAHGLSQGEAVTRTIYDLAQAWLSDSSARRSWVQINRGRRNG